MLSRIGVIGDVHAEHEHLRAALEYLQSIGVDEVVCTGDVVDGKGDLEACIDLLRLHKVATVRGNHDRWLLQNKARHVPDAHTRDTLSPCALKFLQALPSEMSLPTVLGPLMLCHGVGSDDLQKVWPGTSRMPAERSRSLDRIIERGQARLMINGHVHYRTMIHFTGLTLVNAGTLRGDHHPGFSIIDLECREVFAYEFEPEVHLVRRLPMLPASGHRVFENTQHFDGAWTPITLYAAADP